MSEVRCPQCGAVNHIPAERAAEQGKCGTCKALLPRMSGPAVVTDASFDALVLRATTPVLLDCWADWCGPCHMLAPTIDALARDYAGRVLVAKLDVDANPAVAGRFEVRSIPTLRSRGRVTIPSSRIMTAWPSDRSSNSPRAASSSARTAASS